jgi:NodT family efflux transporter outer membrane factor (OMF) lipoprotein
MSWLSLVLPLLGLQGLHSLPAWAQEAAPWEEQASAIAAAQPLPEQAPRTMPRAMPEDDEPVDIAWWQAFSDSLLPQLLASARQASPNLASARARIERARGERVQADAAWSPLLAASATASRGRTEPNLPTTTSSTAGLQATWEIDLFGAGRAGSAAGQEREAGAAQALRAAHLSVTAETASLYVSLRACEAQRLLTRQEIASHERTVSVSERATEAGFLSADQAALARAMAAQAQNALGMRALQCERLLQALASITDQDVERLRAALEPRQGSMPSPSHTLPAGPTHGLLARRPDLQEARHMASAAGHDERAAAALRYPSLSLQGGLGNGRLNTPLRNFDGHVWSIGPVQLTLPFLDGGARHARLRIATAGREEATAVFTAKRRRAEEELGVALATLRNSLEREQHARQAAMGHGLALSAAETRLQGGMASVLEVEQLRRATALARSNVVDLQHTRVHAWITLYRVLGGPW